MKKLLLILASVMCLALLAGCGAGKNDESASQKVLKVGLDPNFPPFEYYQQSTDTYTGFDVELMQALANSMGYGKVEFVNTGLKDLVSGLEAGKYDVIASGLSITPERQKRIDFSDPYLNDGFRIAVTPESESGGSLNDLDGKTVAVKNESFALDLVKGYGKAGKIIETASIEEAINKVIDGEADCTVISKSAGSFFITNGYGGKIKFAGADLANDKVALAVQKGNTKLLESLNTALADYRKTQTFDQLKKTYFGDNM